MVRVSVRVRVRVRGRGRLRVVIKRNFVASLLFFCSFFIVFVFLSQKILYQIFFVNYGNIFK